MSVARRWLFAVVAVAATAAHAALMTPTPAPHLVLAQAGNGTRVSLALPHTIGASNMQQLAQHIAYNNTCTLDKDGKPALARISVTYPSVWVTVTRASSQELLVHWKTRALGRMNSYTLDACTIEAPAWSIKEHRQRISMNQEPTTTDGWTLSVTSARPGIGEAN